MRNAFEHLERPSLPIETEHSEEKRKFSQNEAMLAVLALARDAIVGKQESNPENLNFYISLERSDEDDSWDITLTHKGVGESISVNGYLPDSSWKVCIDDRVKNHCSWDTKTININADTVKAKDFLLVLFHEIGHAYQKAHKDDYIEEPHDSIDVTPLWLQWEMALYAGLAKRERDAWAYSLKNLHDLTNKNFRVFDEFNSYEDIEKSIGYALLAYQVDSNMDLEESFAKEDMTIGSYPIFTKKRPEALLH